MKLPEIIERLTDRAFRLEQHAFAIGRRPLDQPNPDTDKLADAIAMREAARLLGGLVDPDLIEAMRGDIARLEHLNDICAEPSCSGCIARQGRALRLRSAVSALSHE